MTEITNITGYCTKAQELSGICEISGSISLGVEHMLDITIVSDFAFVAFAGLIAVFIITIIQALVNR